MMNSSKMYDKVFAIFGAFMVFFYFGLAIFLLTTKLFDIDKALRIVLAVPLIVYAIYRIFLSVEKIKESFFSKDEEE